MMKSRVSRPALVGLAIVAILGSATACQNGLTDEPQSNVQVQEQVEKPQFSVTAEQVQRWMDEGVELVILDSRSSGGWRSASSMALGAIRVPPHDVAAHLESIPTDTRIIVYCT